MNIEGVTLLNQSIEYLSYPSLIIISIIFVVAGILSGVAFIEKYREVIGSLFISGSVSLFVIFLLLTSSNTSNFTTYPAYTHYIIQIDDKAAWAEIAPNYTIVKEIYPDTGIYEIKREYKEGDE